MKLPSIMLATALWTGLSASNLSSQVIISEIDSSPSGAWIELYNQSPSDFDLSSFSLYHATKTPFRVNDYWFAFAMGTEIKGKDYLRIHWGAPIPSTPPGDPRNIFTGDSTWHFMFGHGFESLSDQQGAIALCNTQLNSQMNNAGIFTDWIQWGGSDFKRGQTAVNSSLWESVTTTIPVGPAGQSLIVIYDERNRVSPPPLTAYDYDYSPTPLAHNAAPLERNDLGGACSVNTSASFELTSNGFPFYGNQGFQLVINGTQGPAFFESMILLFSFESSTAMSPMGVCMALDLTKTYILSDPIATANSSTSLAAPLHTPASLAGVNFYLQTLVISSGYHGFSNILQLTISN